MNCPNCDITVDRVGSPVHLNGCVIGSLLSVLQDRGHDLSHVDLSKIDVDMLWDEYCGPATDALAGMLDLGSPYPLETGA